MGTADALNTANDFAATARRLRQRLAGALPGHAAQARLAPDARATPPGAASVEGRTDCREAGVLAVLYPAPEDGRSMLVFTERRDHLDDHAGQVSFPGGRREAGESLRQTALREAREEIALAPEAVTVLGALTPLYIPPSNYCVHPFVAAAAPAPSLTPADAEVAAILRVPLADLLAPDALTRETWTLHGRATEVPFYEGVGTPPIWGATSMMLAELLALF